MEKKKVYLESAVEVVKFDNNDVITASNPSHGGTNELPDMTPDD